VVQAGLNALGATAAGAALGPALPFVVGGALVGTVLLGAGVTGFVDRALDTMEEKLGKD
jgi:hypothetical protein